MSRLLAPTCLMTVVLLGGAHRTHAQDAPDPQDPKPPAAQPAEQEPKRPLFHGSLTVGFALAAGVQEQRGHQIAGSLVHPFSDGGRFVANAARQYQKVTFPSESLLADRTTIAVGADHGVTKHTVAMVRSMYLQDEQLLVNSRFEQLAGYGLHIRNKARTMDFALVPGVSIYKQDLAYPADEGWIEGFGFFEKFAGKFDKVWSVENEFRFRQNFGDTHRSIESVASLTGMIVKPVGLQMEFQYNYESIVPPGFPNYLAIVSVGLRFQF